MPEIDSFSKGDPLKIVLITPNMVLKKLSALNQSKSPGQDGLHPRVLKELKDVIALPLSIIYNISLNQGILPMDWKISQVSPIFKKGDKKEAGNYRPVSLTAVCCKMMKSIIRDNIMTHMTKYNLFCDEQHGFVPGRSCMTQLLVTLDDWTELLDQGLPVDAIYLDFKKAFDTVPHERLLLRAESCGIQGDVLQWLRAFLVGRNMIGGIEFMTSQRTTIIKLPFPK